MKTCLHCGKEFQPSKSHGYAVYCSRACQSVEAKKRANKRIVLEKDSSPEARARYEAFRSRANRLRKNIPETNKKNNLAWKNRNPEKVSKQVNTWREANPENVKGWRKKHGKKWREGNKEKARESVRAWEKNNPDKVKENRNKWKLKNSEKVKSYSRAWRGDNPEKVSISNAQQRNRRRSLVHDLTFEEWQKALRFFDNKCAYCGCELTLSHKEHFISAKAGGGLTRSNIVPACKNCNSRKSSKNPLDWLVMQAQGLVTYVRITQYLQGQI